MSDAPSMMEGSEQDANAMAAKVAAEAVPDPGRQIYLDEARTRTEAALGTEIGFVERLVWFWSNHFCISADKIQSMSGAYEREAIRPHVVGRFADMLLAVEGHPAMLIYLDNIDSIGPNSIAGINRARGLNENIAREILELHTLGVRSGYSQDDVLSFAKVVTGWTLLPPANNPEHGGEFSFNPRLHEPGAQQVIGRSTRTKRWNRDAACFGIWPRIRRPPRTSPPSWLATSLPIRLRLRWLRGWQRFSSIPPAISRRSRGRWCRRTNPGRSRPPSSSARASGSSAWCGPPAFCKRILRGSRPGKRCSANPCGVPRRPKVIRTTKHPGLTAWGGGWTSPITSPSACRTGPIPRRSSRPCSDLRYRPR